MSGPTGQNRENIRTCLALVLAVLPTMTMGRSGIGPWMLKTGRLLHLTTPSQTRTAPILVISCSLGRRPRGSTPRSPIGGLKLHNDEAGSRRPAKRDERRLW